MSDTAETNIPERFLCPISAVIFSHPIRTETGHVFERGAIMEWVYFGKGNCPMSRKPLHPSHFSPDVKLEQEIKEWRVQNNLPASADHESDDEDDEEEDDLLVTELPAMEGVSLRQLLAPAVPESDKMTELLQLRAKVLENRDRRLANFQSRRL